MKKMLAVTAMAALVAGAAFAAPSFSTNAKIQGNLIKADTTGSYTILGTPANKSEQGWEASVAGEKAGASIGSWNGGFTGVNHQDIWFKPFDMVTLSVNAGDWCGFSYGVDIDLSPVSVSFGLPGDFVKDGKLAKGSSVTVGYSNDTIGKVSLTAAYKDAMQMDCDGDNKFYDKPAGLPATAENVAAFGLSYSGSFSPVTVASQTNLNLYKIGDDTVPAVAEKLTVSAKVDTVSVSVANTVTASPINGDNKFKVEFARSVLSASMPVSDYTAYLNVTEANWLTIKDQFAMDYKVGLKGKYDVMSWDVGLKVAVDAKTTFSVPFTVSVGL